MKRTRRKAPLPCEAGPVFASGEPGVRSRGPARHAPARGVRLLASGALALVFLHGASCGVKAPPQPRERVVPAPVEDVEVMAVPEGLRITFTLPSNSLDGSPLKTIGGYRIVREGPDGKSLREDVRLSVSEMRQRVGGSVAYLDEPPEKGGAYRYCVFPVDGYGSHPARSRVLEFCWEGFLEGRAAGPGGESGQEGE